MADDQSIDMNAEVPSTEPAEPALSTGGIVAGTTLLINGLVMFGLTITPEQKLYLIALITFAAPLLTALWIRFKVWSPRTVDRIISEFRQREATHQRQIDQAKAEVVAARAASDAVQASIPSVVQGLVGSLGPQQPLNGSLSAPEPEPLRPPSERVYGLPQTAQPAPPRRPRNYPTSDERWADLDEGRTTTGTAQQPRYIDREETAREREQPRAPRGYGRRHALDPDR